MTGAVTARAANKAVSDVPIVFAVVVDPVADHVVPNLERPGGNPTGTTSFDPQQAEMQLQLLRKVIPTIKRVAILGDKGVSEALIKASDAQAQAMGRRLRFTGPDARDYTANKTDHSTHAHPESALGRGENC